MAAYFCTASDLQSRLSSIGYSLSVNDDPNAATQALQRSANEIRLYCSELYEESDLQANASAGGWVNDKATDLAVYYLRGRRGNPRPESIFDDRAQAVEELQNVRLDLFVIPGLAQRHHSAPVFSNIRVDPTYTYKKIRVENQTSSFEGVKGYPQYFDWLGLLSYEY